jgi:tetratricopeptide (TPR) repeat protein
MRILFLFSIFFALSQIPLAQEERPLDEYFYGLKALKSNKLDSAIHYFSACTELNPTEIEYLNSLSKAYFINKEYNQAIAILSKINTRKPGFADFNLAKCYVQKENIDSAFLFLESHLNSKYQKYESEIKLDPVISKLDTLENWQNLWKNEWYTSYEHQLADVEYNIRIKNYKLAQTILNDIFSKRNNPHKALYLSAILNKEQTFYHAALNDIEIAIDKRKTNDEYFYLLAELQSQFKKDSKALQSINKALELNKFNLEYYRLKAIILNNLEKYDEAISYYRYFLKFTKYGYQELYLLSQIYYRASDNIKSLKYINQALKLNANSKDLYILRGKIYLASNMYKYAERDFTMSLDFDYQNGEVYFLRAQTRFHQGEKEGACRDWQKARNLNYVEAEEFLRKHCLR